MTEFNLSSGALCVIKIVLFTTSFILCLKTVFKITSTMIKMLISH